MVNVLASIDIGTHTARLLIVKKSPLSNMLQPLTRQRAYIRLAEGIGFSREKIIKPDALDRILEVLHDFCGCINRFKVDHVSAVATGFFREAVNNDEVVKKIYKDTGIKVRIITGEEEAMLSGKAALHTLGLENAEPFVVVDLGGGSTEFMFSNSGSYDAVSLPLGGAVLQEMYLKSDPPDSIQINALGYYIDQIMADSPLKQMIHLGNPVLIGTGGTITTLAALIHGISLRPADPERLNGLEIRLSRVEELFDHMKAMGLSERIKSYGLERDRAMVIPAGIFIIIRLMHFFGSDRIISSFSDLLEGLLFLPDMALIGRTPDVSAFCGRKK